MVAPRLSITVQRVLRKRNRHFIARNTAPIVAVIEIANIASDSRALQCAALQELRVVSGQLMTNHCDQRATAMRRVRIAMSVTLRPIGPAVSCSWAIGIIPSCETRPSVGFKPTMFSTADGPVIDPSVSVPTATEHKFAADAIGRTSA